jgi:hypothetical protein
MFASALREDDAWRPFRAQNNAAGIVGFPPHLVDQRYPPEWRWQQRITKIASLLITSMKLSLLWMNFFEQALCKVGSGA